MDFLTGEGERDESTDDRPLIRKVVGRCRFLIVGVDDTDDVGEESLVPCRFEDLFLVERSRGEKERFDGFFLGAFFLVLIFSLAFASLRAAEKNKTVHYDRRITIYNRYDAQALIKIIEVSAASE